MKYLFATNINGTEQTGIVNTQMQLLCLCPKENADVILKALEKSPLVAAALDMYEFIDSFIRSFEADYLLDGKIVSNPSTLLLVNYKHAKQVLAKARGENPQP